MNITHDDRAWAWRSSTGRDAQADQVGFRSSFDHENLRVASAATLALDWRRDPFLKVDRYIHEPVAGMQQNVAPQLGFQIRPQPAAVTNVLGANGAGEEVFLAFGFFFRGKLAENVSFDQIPAYSSAVIHDVTQCRVSSSRSVSDLAGGRSRCGSE